MRVGRAGHEYAADCYDACGINAAGESGCTGNRLICRIRSATQLINELDPKAALRARTRAAALQAGAHVLAAEVAGRMDQRLDLMKILPGRVLDAGGGASLGLLRRRYPASALIAIDDALAIVSRERGEGGWLARLQGLLGAGKRPALAVAARLERLPLADQSIDLVWSNLALQRAGDPLPWMREWQRVLAADGLFIFSSLGPDTLKELRRAFAAAHPGRAHVHDFIDMHDLGDMLVEAGFAAPVMEMETLTLTYDNVMTMAADLRAMGAANALVARRRGLSGRGLWERAGAAYEAMRRDGRLPASFEIVYGHAWKPKPRQAAGKPQAVKFYPNWERPK
jgi:malonyl-CoA O-methyltransferase